MSRCGGQLFGAPDFCTLRITAGSEHGLPSPGHTILTDNGDGTYAVSSSFDVRYRIEFEGCPGSKIEGLSGTTELTIHMTTGNEPDCDGVCGPDEDCVKSRVVLLDGTIDICCDCRPRTGACCLVDNGCVVTTATDCGDMIAPHCAVHTERMACLLTTHNSVASNLRRLTGRWGRNRNRRWLDASRLSFVVAGRRREKAGVTSVAGGW